MKTLVRTFALLSLTWSAATLAHTHLLRSMPVDGADVAGSPPAEVHVKLPALAPGRYRLSWRAASADGHVMTGQISFTVGDSAQH